MSSSSKRRLAGRSAATRYGLAVLAGAGALFLTVSFLPLFHSAPFLLFVTGVSAAALYGGLGPGLLTTALITLGSAYFLFPPNDLLAVDQDAPQLAIFSAVGVLISVLAAARRRTEGKTLEHQQFLRTTLRSIGDGVIATDVRDRVTFMNAVAQQLTGWTEEQARGRNLREVFPLRPADDQPMQEAAEGRWDRRADDAIPLKGVDASGANAVKRLLEIPERGVLVGRDGMQRAIESNAARIETEHGEQLGVIVVFRDVSERDRTRAALRESEERYRTVAETASDAIITIDESSTILYVNPAAEAIFGYPREEMLGRPLTMLMPERLHDSHRAGVRHYARTGERRIPWAGLELPGLTKDGREIPLEISFGESRQGGDHTFTGIVRDIGERKRREEALRQSEARFRQLADAMPQIVWAAGADGSVDYFNRRWYDYTGSAAGVGGEASWTAVLHAADVQAALERWRACLRSGEILEIETRFKDGTTGDYRWHLTRALPIRDESGAIVRWFGTSTDIDEQKRSQEAMAEAARRKDEFLSTVSHELRTPLQAILGWARLLQAGQLDEAASGRAVDTIERNARVQTQLVEDILDVSRVITGKLRLNLQPVELVPVIEAAIDTVRPAAEAKDIRLTSALDPMAGVVSGDPARLQQIVWNLLSNAIKFTPKSGQVHIGLERVISHVEIAVSDNGEGLSPQFIPYLFDRFRQADGTTTRRHGGLGLGLAIVRHLAELHGGTVRAESSGKGQGATFTVSLPLRALRVMSSGEGPGSGRAAHASVAAPSLQGLHVLVVDDEPDARDLLNVLLSQAGASVTVVASAAEALDAVTRRRPDVLVSDISMPDEDGYSLIRKVRAQEPRREARMPAIALTAHARGEDRIRALSSGYQAHVAKPVDPDELVLTITSLTGGRRG